MTLFPQHVVYLTNKITFNKFIIATFLRLVLAKWNFHYKLCASQCWKSVCEPRFPQLRKLIKRKELFTVKDVTVYSEYLLSHNDSM